MYKEEENLIVKDNSQMYTCCWKPDDKVQGVIAFIHGIGEHIGVYEHVANVFCRNGLAFCGMDMRGHGRSSGKRGCIPSYEAIMDDIEFFIEYLKSQYPDLPIIIYGHSMGGNFTINYVLRRKPEIVGVIASSPWLELAFEPPSWKTLIGKVLNRLLPSFTMSNGLNAGMLTRDTGHRKSSLEGEGYKLSHNRISARLYCTVYEAGKWAIQNADVLELPILIMHGTEDKTTSCEASVRFIDRVNSDKTIRLWDGGYHELHNDINKEEVMKELVAWVLRVIH